MAKGPDFVHNIEKTTTDFFYKGYDSSFGASITGTDSSGENPTIHCGAITDNSFSLATSTRLNKENITAGVNMDIRSGPSATIAFDKIVPGLKTIFSFNPTHEKLGQVEFRYERDINKAISTTLDLTSNPQINFSGLITHKAKDDSCVSIATDVLLNTATRGFTKYDMGCEWSSIDSRISFTLKDKLSIKTLSALLNKDSQTTLYCECIQHGRGFSSMDFTIGCQHKLNRRTSLKVHSQLPLNHDCVRNRVRASISHELFPNCLYTINGDIPWGAPPSVGFSLSFML